MSKESYIGGDYIETTGGLQKILQERILRTLPSETNLHKTDLIPLLLMVSMKLHQ